MIHESEIRIVHLISGSGSTMARIRQESLSGELQGKVLPVAVISNVPDAPGLQKAQALGIPWYVVDKKQFPTQQLFGERIVEIAKHEEAQVILQNGWIPFTPPHVIYEFEGRIFNQHPAPLDPDFLRPNGTPKHFGGKLMYGLAVHAAVLKFQELSNRRFRTEATIHHVTPAIDGGAVVFRRGVPVSPDDTPEQLHARVLPVEHESHIVFLNQLYRGAVTVQHRSEALIGDDEVGMLDTAIIYGGKTYPKG